MRAQAKPPSQKDWYMDPLVMNFSKKMLIHQVNYNPNSTFFPGTYFSYRAIWGMIRRDFEHSLEPVPGNHSLVEYIFKTIPGSQSPVE